MHGRMRRALALPLLAVLAAASLAGCSDDPNTPPNADPQGGGHSLPPTSTNPTATGPPMGNETNTTTATATSTGPAASFGAHDQEDSTNHDDFPGLLVSGRLRGSGAQVTVEGTASNIGQRTYKVPDGQCMQPWTESMRGPGGQDVVHRQPMATCLAFGLREFPSNDFLATALAWNGTLWTGDGFAVAPSGTYTWEVTFHVYWGGSGAEFEDHALMTLSFDVTVP